MNLFSFISICFVCYTDTDTHYYNYFYFFIFKYLSREEHILFISISLIIRKVLPSMQVGPGILFPPTLMSSRRAVIYGDD